MKRPLLLLSVIVAVVLAACGGDDGASSTSGPGDGGTTTTVAASETTAAPASTIASPGEWDLSGIEIRMGQPRLWRMVTEPPEGADATIYAPSDNNAVAERLSVTAVPLDATATAAEQAETAINDLEAHFDAIVIQATTSAQVGIDGRPAQQLRFTWQQPTEAGVGWRWVFRGDTQLLFVTFLADLSEPNLYTPIVQEMLDGARIGS